MRKVSAQCPRTPHQTLKLAEQECTRYLLPRSHSVAHTFDLLGRASISAQALKHSSRPHMHTRSPSHLGHPIWGLRRRR